MIVEFSVKNFRSIAELQTISFIATNLKSSRYNDAVDDRNIVEIGDSRLLKTIGIYGANASGKSNIIKAFELFSEAVSDLPSPESRLSKLVQPFLYQGNAKGTESFFQIILIIEGRKYRYGFTVKNNSKSKSKLNSSSQIITSEWLFGPINKNQGKYFTRRGLKIDKSNLPDSSSIATLEYEHTLFLTHAASYNKDICAKIRNVIKGYVASMFNARSDYYRFHSIRQIGGSKVRSSGNQMKPEEIRAKSRLLEFLKSFGLDYKDIYFENDDKPISTNDYSLDKLFLTKQSTFGDIHLNMEANESAGTRKLFDIAGLLLHAFNLKTSGLIILDEIDSNFHPSLLINLIKMFNDPEINRSNVQLLFTSHDTNLMNPSLMRRDQFYFAEKDNMEATRLYALSDLKGIRNDADFAKQYLAGFYGGMPILSDYLSNEKKVSDNGTLGY